MKVNNEELNKLIEFYKPLSFSELLTQKEDMEVLLKKCKVSQLSELSLHFKAINHLYDRKIAEISQADGNDIQEEGSDINDHYYEYYTSWSFQNLFKRRLWLSIMMNQKDETVFTWTAMQEQICKIAYILYNRFSFDMNTISLPEVKVDAWYMVTKIDEYLLIPLDKLNTKYIEYMVEQNNSDLDVFGSSRMEAIKYAVVIIKHQKEEMKEEKSNMPDPSNKPDNPSFFDKVITARLDKSKELLLVKGKEYVRNNDRFHNFNRTADMNKETPTRSLHGMHSKHLTSYLDMLDDIDKGNIPTEEYVNEKMGDIIVYFLLQEAQIKNLYFKP